MLEYVWRRAHPQRIVMAFCAVVAAAVAFGVHLQPGPRPAPVAGPTPGPAARPSRAPATATPSPSATPADPRVVALGNATIDIPVWPGGRRMSTACPAGPHAFAGRAATAGLVDGTQNTYHVTPLVAAALDATPGEGYLVSLSCDNDVSFHPQLLLGVKTRPDGTVQVLGPVITTGSGELYDYDRDSLRVADRTVRVQVYGPHRSNGAPAFQQQRSYRYDGTAFRQVDGPTTSPADERAIRDVDLRNTEIYVAGRGDCGARCDYGGMVTFVDGKGTALTGIPQADAEQQATFTIDQVTYGRVRQRGLAFLTVTVRGPGGHTRRAVLVAAYRDESGGVRLTTASVLEEGDDGVTGIVSQHGDGDHATVTVTTASGQQAREYRSDDGDLWSWRRSG
ncbi:hypothetical protein Lfu02_78820 [Longispora fulva]|uniref:Uncharacterized protein n=1 Tax=Longispora fulva TaxID=619741 RepID=A0A8J7GGL4_9ACTN|nr:hypothetical protein [Longispora fulva]MBG6134009.1 hypothetical protein [Longispora fulva]GIG63510.1 hypothetical protein Lfu02_78820 [Longispora fulva]